MHYCMIVKDNGKGQETCRNKQNPGTWAENRCKTSGGGVAWGDVCAWN